MRPFTLLLVCAAIFVSTQITLPRLCAQYTPSSLGNTDHSSFKGIDPRRRQVRKSNDPWFGLNKQLRCPITGRRNVKSGRGHYVEYMGHRIWLSSRRLTWIFRKFPRRSIRRMFDWGERPERLPNCPADFILPVPPPRVKR